MKARHNFTLSPEAYAILRAAAKAQGVSMSTLVETLIRALPAKAPE
jgi:predicted HicB family RNase H-like nuclease